MNGATLAFFKIQSKAKDISVAPQNFKSWKLAIFERFSANISGYTLICVQLWETSEATRIFNILWLSLVRKINTVNLGELGETMLYSIFTPSVQAVLSIIKFLFLGNIYYVGFTTTIADLVFKLKYQQNVLRWLTHKPNTGGPIIEGEEERNQWQST